MAQVRLACNDVCAVTMRMQEAREQAATLAASQQRVAHLEGQLASLEGTRQQLQVGIGACCGWACCTISCGGDGQHRHRRPSWTILNPRWRLCSSKPSRSSAHSSRRLWRLLRMGSVRVWVLPPPRCVRRADCDLFFCTQRPACDTGAHHYRRRCRCKTR